MYHQGVLISAELLLVLSPLRSSTQLLSFEQPKIVYVTPDWPIRTEFHWQGNKDGKFRIGKGKDRRFVLTSWQQRNVVFLRT